MAYDFSGPWTQVTGHQAQLFAPEKQPEGASGRAAISYMYHQGVPLKRILLGIPVYGRSFLGASDVDQHYYGHGGQEGTFEYRDLPRPGAQEVHHADCVAVASVGGDGGFVSYDNVDTVETKAKFVHQHKLGGLFYWHIGGDKKGRDSLVETGYNALQALGRY